MTTTDLEDHPAGPTEPAKVVAPELPSHVSARGAEALGDIWQRLARPFDAVSTIAALLGLPAKTVGQLVGMTLATSDEADALLDAFPHTVRALATSTNANAERCVGDLRGPVLWSETISARAATAGQLDLFICSTPSRAYDTDENRVLVHALDIVKRAARDAQENDPGRTWDDPQLRRARRNGGDAARFMEHPSLASVQRGRPKPRAVNKTRTGRSHKIYEPALAMLARAQEPMAVDDLLPLCDLRTQAQHVALMGVVRRLESHGARLPDFRVERGALYTGPVQYYHPSLRGETGRVSGILVGQLVVDVPDRPRESNRERADAGLRARVGGWPCALVTDEADLDAAVARAVELARRR